MSFVFEPFNIFLRKPVRLSEKVNSIPVSTDGHLLFSLFIQETDVHRSLQLPMLGSYFCSITPPTSLYSTIYLHKLVR